MKCRKTTTLGAPASCRLVPRSRTGKLAGRMPTLPAVGGKLKLGLQRGLQRQRGVALVITLIMLAVITIITVLFLATAQRNRSSTTVRIDQTTAEFAAETAYQHATGKIIERILNDRNLLSFDFFVSRPLAYFNVTNNGLVSPAEPNSIPRVANDSNTVGTFLDLNRTQLFDDPGDSNRPFGDPIWLGILDRPWFPHSKTNRFVARLAYMVLPVGKSLDANNIHHDTARPAFNPGFGYMRNQGFGPWELNLAAFLHEFNPGYWDYDYYSVGGRPNTAGRAFEDALSIVRYREGWPADALSVPVSQTFSNVYPDAFFNNFPSSSIDVYSDGDLLGYPLGADISLPGDDNTAQKLNARWPGADTTNHFFHHQEFFQHADVGGRSNKATYGFYLGLSNTLAADGSAYYRMMTQLGMNTGSDFENRINLNFADKHANLPGTNFSATNFVAWDASPELAVAFFTNVAQRIFLAQSNEFNPLGTNQLVLRSMLEIPVYPTNRYSSAVHRILQMAANIFDATRTNIYPSVFRPVFGKKLGDPLTVYVVGYENDERLSTLPAWLNNNTNGVPLVVGAKKGFPNFNEFTMRSDILVARKIQFTRASTAPFTSPNGTNQMYVLGISNYFGTESWNSYDVNRGAAAYPRELRITVTNFARASLTNSLGFQTNDVQYAAASMLLPANSWTGGLLGGTNNAFRLPLSTNQVLLSNSVYSFNQNRFANISTNAFENLNNTFPVPDWTLTISNRLAYWMVEPGLDRIIDFVLLEDSHVVDLHRELVTGVNPYAGYGGIGSSLWSTNRTVPNGPTDGITRQIDISRGALTANSTDAEWREFAQAAVGNENDKQAAINGFAFFMGLTPPYPGVAFVTNDSLTMETPFNPAVKLAAVSTWQANDPLVHYHPEDLRIDIVTNHQILKPMQAADNVAPASLTNLNPRYAPWNGSPVGADYPETGDLMIKDPGVNGSVDWAFPSNKLATVGVLGRVHRGTPWQTVYLKPDIAPMNQWMKQSSDGVLIAGRTVSRSHPTNDWLLLDMFTTGLDERTGRGLVSVNQTNMETWSALFGGILVLSNNVEFPILNDPRSYEEQFVRPFGQGDPATNGFYQIWTNIYRYQLAKGRPLTSVGELIQNVPELTTRSPFLNQGDGQLLSGLDDFAFEQIPQQILPLLRVGQSRFVVYAYGQALKPERINSGNGAVENYQVTAEFATRTVLRVEGNPRDRVRVVVESFNILPPD